MGMSDVELVVNTGPVVDLTAQGLQKLGNDFACSDDTHTLILDRNHIMKLDHLEKSRSLQQLSVAGNRLIRMMGVAHLIELRVLNLPNNSIGYIEGLRHLVHLKWLNLSGNNIKVIEQLNSCTSIQHLDLSDNNISNIGDLTKLVALKTLLLHGNGITTLRTAPAHLPAHLSILSLAENELRDLNEVSYLATLHELEQLSIMSNPCVMATPSLPGFDYRPYIMSWCLNLKVLDGYVVSQKEGLRAEWLYSQGKGRSYRLGQHVQLVQYLATVCPLTSSPGLETAEDAKLEKILSKQRMHQKQLLEESQVSSASPPRPTQLDVGKSSPPSAAALGGSRETSKVASPTPAGAQSTGETEPVVQYNTWVSSDPSHPPQSSSHGQRGADDHMYLEDVPTDEDKLNSSMLSSDSMFLPFASNTDPPPSRSDSEDETETFEPDSLAPKYPAQPKQHKTHAPPSPHRQEVGNTVRDAGAAITSLPAGVRTSTPQDFLQAAPDDGAPRTSEDVAGPTRFCSEKANSAAVKIQSWWRGQHTRRRHPVAVEVRTEIRLHRMQEHIVFLSGELHRVQKQYEEERLQRRVQEEVVKHLWKQVQSMQHWQRSVEHHLIGLSQAVAPAQIPAPGPCEPAANASHSAAEPACTSISSPDSGFELTSERQPAQEDSFLSSGTTDSLNTVRALSPAFNSCADAGGCGDNLSPDCSLLVQYLSSVQQSEEEEEEAAEEGAGADRTETPQPSSPESPRKSEQASSPPDHTADNQPHDGGSLSGHQKVST